MAKIPDCHPDRKHKGRGLCSQCYHQLPDVKSRINEKARERYKTPEGKAIVERANDKYKSSPKGKSHYKEYFKEYNKTQAKKDSSRKYSQTEMGKESSRRNAKKHAKTEHGKKRIRPYNNYMSSIIRSGQDFSLFKSDIIEVYKNCPKGLVVDHILPIKGSNKVTGLNVPWNMQYLTKSENSRKHNFFDGTYDNESWRYLRIQCVETGEVFETQYEAAAAINTNQGSINAVLKGRYKKTKGYTFIYVNISEPI